MKALIALSMAVAATALSASASAQVRVMGPHAETEAALKCLLEHDHGQKQKMCDGLFVGSASLSSKFWLWWDAEKDFKLGPLLSSDYAGTQAVNAYLTTHLNGRAADVYDVKYKHYEKSFYIVPPAADGKVRYLHVREGAPDDEKTYLFRGG